MTFLFGEKLGFCWAPLKESIEKKLGTLMSLFKKLNFLETRSSPLPIFKTGITFLKVDWATHVAAADQSIVVFVHGQEPFKSPEAEEL